MKDLLCAPLREVHSLNFLQGTKDLLNAPLWQVHSSKFLQGTKTCSMLLYGKFTARNSFKAESALYCRHSWTL